MAITFLLLPSHGGVLLGCTAYLYRWSTGCLQVPYDDLAALDAKLSGDRNIAAFMVEPIQVVGCEPGGCQTWPTRARRPGQHMWRKDMAPRS